MKDTALLTITTINKTWVVPLGKASRFAMLLVVFSIFIGFAISATIIYQFNDKIDSLESKKQQLLDTVLSLNTTREVMQQQIELQKVSLGKLEALEKLAGTDINYEELDNANTDTFSKQKHDELLERIRTARVSISERRLMLQSVPSGMPITRKTYVTSGYGPRIHPVTGKKEKHFGIDLFTGIGDDIFATADGIVEYSGYSASFGHSVRITHNFGFTTVYGHLDKRLVSRGDVVSKGQVIGKSGNSGVSTGPHLHYEVAFLKKKINPRSFMRWSLDNYDEVFVNVKEVRWTQVVNRLEYMLAQLKDTPQLLPTSINTSVGK